MVRVCVSKLNREQNRSSYMVWVGVSKLNRVRTEQVELLGLSRHFKTEQNRDRTEHVELHG